MSLIATHIGMRVCSSSISGVAIVLMCAAMISSTELPLNGSTPLAKWYSVTPSE